MLNMECVKPTTSVTSESSEWEFVLPETVIFELVQSIPNGISDQIQEAVEDFIRVSGTPHGIDLAGFYNQTLQAIATSAIVGQGRDLWLGIHNNELYTYILANIGPDFDGRLAYTVIQAWVRKDQRGKPWVKKSWTKVRQRAKDTLCSHFVVHSTKENTAAYCRFLGKGFHKVSEVLKEEL